MNKEDLQELVKAGLSALQSGGKIAAKATDDIKDDATNPELRAALDQGNATAKEWTKRVEQAIEEAGDVPEQDNEIIEAHYEASKDIRAQAKTADVRDLGIITSGQLALHYWIAAFGTLASYAEALGLTQTAQAMQQSATEAKQADEQHTALAKKMLAAN